MTRKERMERMAVAREQVYLEIVYDIDMCGDTVYIKGEIGGDLIEYRLMQSGKIIRNLRIVSTSPKKATTEPVRAFVTTQKSNKELHKYESVMSMVRYVTERCG